MLRPHRWRVTARAGLRQATCEGFNMGDIVIVAYRPKPGREADLAALGRAQVPDLRAWGLATDRPSTLMQGAGGTIVEVFEWHEGAVARAHEDPRVLAMWARYGEVCDFIGLRDVAETAELFATFHPLEDV
jgi:hypothetical protein